MQVLLTILCAGFLMPLILAQNDENNYYSKRYDNLDVNTIFRSSRLLNNYVDCLLDKKPCPPEGKDLKRVLPDALRTKCALCTKIQKRKALDVITRLYYQHPSIYTALAGKYDPTGGYTRRFEDWFDQQNAVKPRPPIPSVQRDEDFNFAVPDVQTTSESVQPNVESSIPIVFTTTQQPSIRRSPNIIDAQNQNSITQRPRLSLNITPPPTQMTTVRRQTTQRTLRTSQATRPTVRTTTIREQPSVDTMRRNPQANQSPIMRIPQNQAPVQQQQPQPSRDYELPPPPPPNPTLIDNFFIPRRNGPFTRSINKILDTTEKVGKQIAGMFQSTIEIILG